MDKDESRQDFIEKDAHSFVINIWFEQDKPNDQVYLWRGHITHVASGNKQYLTQLSAISKFIRKYLPQQKSVSTWRARLGHLWFKITQE